MPSDSKAHYGFGQNSTKCVDPVPNPIYPQCIELPLTSQMECGLRPFLRNAH